MIFKIGWDRLEGRYLDKKFVKRKWDAGSKRHFEINDYMVEIDDLEGRPTRLVVRDRALFLRLPPQGSLVPLRVNKRRTKAAFDRKGTSIDPGARLERHDEAARAADEARFEARLKGEPVPPARDAEEEELEALLDEEPPRRTDR